LRLAQIEQFITIVEVGSIRGAARHLGMSQPALTRALQQLEHDLGVQLLQRTIRGIALTEVGAAFLPRARVANAELRKAADEARGRAARAGQLLTLAVSPVGASLLLPDLFGGLRARHAGARVRVMEMPPSAVLPLVRDDIADIGISQRTRAGLDAGLRFKALFEVQMRVAARPGHPARAARTLGDLADASWLAMTVPGSTEDIVSLSFRKLGLPPPEPVAHCGSYSVSIDMVAESDLLTVLPPNVLISWIRAGRLMEIPLVEPVLPLVVGSYTRADTPPTPVARTASLLIAQIARRRNSDEWLRRNLPLPTGRARP
jgi:LysR family transcriptional regulator, regulator of abg operon